ncbi:hypothetical protein Hanom_Chr06g00569001 [Helianthus anomalus]
MPIILIPIILITIIIFIYLLITKNLIKTFRYKHLPCYDAKHPFINGAQFLSKSRSTSNRTIADTHQPSGSGPNVLEEDSPVDEPKTRPKRQMRIPKKLQD